MHSLQKYFLSVKDKLGIEVMLDYPITLSSGRQITALVYVPYFGSDKGTVVCAHFDEIRSCANEMVDDGYGASTLRGKAETCGDNPPIEMFSEWGWGGPPEQKPKWFVDKGPWNDPDDENYYG